MTLLLCLIITATMMPVTAYGDTVSQSTTWTGSIGATTISGGTTADPVVITVDGAVTVTGEITVTGHVIFTGGGTLKRGADYKGKVININEASATAVLENITIDGSAVTSGSKSLVYVTSGKCTMNDGVITGNKASSYGGGVYICNGATFEMNGGTISNNNSNSWGGGIFNDGILIMSDGEISGNSSMTSGRGGGGVYNAGDFTMSGGTISGNEAGTFGGGVYNWEVDGTAGTYTFTMSGGEISGNTAGACGGVCNRKLNNNKSSTVTITGGEITENVGKGQAGGMYMDTEIASGLSELKVIIGGNPNITDNTITPTNISSNFVIEGNYKTFTLDDETPLQPGAKIGITCGDDEVFASCNTISRKIPQCFFKDEDPSNDKYKVVHGSVNRITGLYFTTKNPSISVDPSSVSFGVGNDPQTVTITNNGEIPLTIFKPESEKFTIGGFSDDSQNLAANKTITFTISPKAGYTVGTQTENITVYTGSSATANVHVDYTGEPATYILAVTPPTFSDVKYGYTRPDAKPIAITSTGNSDATVSSVTLSGADAGSFTLNKTNGTTIKAGLTDNTTYTIQPNADLGVSTYTATVTVKYDGGATATADITFTVGKADQATPDAPTVTDNTINSITVNSTAGQQYIVKLTSEDAPSGDEWNAAETGTGEAIVFSGLESGKEYTVYTRKAGNDTHNPSLASKVDTYTLPTAPDAGSIISGTNGITLDYGVETVTIKGNVYEVYIPSDSTVPQDSTTANLTNKDTAASIKAPLDNSRPVYVRVKAKAPVPASAWVAVNLTARPETPAPVAEPTRDKVTDSTMTISVTAGCEYILTTSSTAPTDVVWSGDKYYKAETTGTYEFTGLTANTAYYVHVRKAATTTAPASSAATSDAITTKTAPAAAPGTGDMTDVNKNTKDTIKINGKTGYEYVLLPTGDSITDTDWDNAKQCQADGVLSFDKDSKGANLVAGTEYKVYVRKTGTGTDMPSNPAEQTTYTKQAEPTAENIQGSVTLDYGAETVKVNGTTYEVFVPSSPKTDTCTAETATVLDVNNKAAITSAIPNNGGTGNIYVRVKKNGEVPASAWVEVNLTARPETPTAVDSDNITKTDTVITIDPAAANQEYSSDNGATWTTPAAGKVSFNNLTKNTEYSIVTRVKAEGNIPASKNSEVLTVKTKNTQNAPTAPTQDSITASTDSLTVKNSVSGQEYIVVPRGTTPNWENATEGTSGNLVFSPLTPGTEYDVYTRMSGTDDKMPSPSSKVTVGTLPTKPTADIVGNNESGIVLDYTDETVTIKGDVYEVYIPLDSTVPQETTNANLTNKNTATSITSPLDNSKPVYVRVKAKGEVPASAWVPVTLAARPQIPTAVDIGNITKTDTVITINPAAANQEYSSDNGATWITPTAGKVSFDNLVKDTDYNIVTRVKANGNTPASKNSEVLTVKTKATQEAPAVPSVNGANNTDSTITVANSNSDYEYIVVPKTTSQTAPTEEQWKNNGTKGTGNAIGLTKDYNGAGLEPGTEYTVLVRKTGSDTAMPSDTVSKDTYTKPTDPTSQEAQGSVTLDYMTETVTISSTTYEVYVPTGGETPEATTSANVTGSGSIKAPLDNDKPVYVRVKAKGEVPASEWVAVTLNPRPTVPTVPTAPARDKVTNNAMTISVTAGYEYILTTSPNAPTDVVWSGVTNNGYYNATADGSHKFEGLNANETYYVHVRKAATVNDPASSAATSDGVTTKATQDAPATPTVSGTGNTDSTITVTGSDSGYEYIIVPKTPPQPAPTEEQWKNNGTKGTGSTINLTKDYNGAGLEPGTEYTVLVRKTGSDTAMPSDTASTDTYTKPVKPSAEEISAEITVDYTTETITSGNTGYEMYIGNSEPTSGTAANVTSGASGNLTSAIDGGKTVYIRKKSAGSVPASEWSSMTIAARPASPTSLTLTSETVKGKGDGKISGITTAMEYSTGNQNTWTTGTGNDISLAVGAEIHVRIKATDAAPHGETADFTGQAGTATLTVKFNTNGGSTISDITGIEYNANIKSSEPASPTRSGYTFTCWTIDAAGNIGWDFDTHKVTNSMTIFAQWNQDASAKSITGTVKTTDNSGTQAPIGAGASVILKRGNAVYTQATTDAQGEYTFANVKAGIYNVEVKAPDNRTMVALVTVEEDGTGSLTVTDIVFPFEQVSSSLVVWQGTPNIMVDGLEKEAVAKSENITMKITIKDENTAANAGDIITLAGGQKDNLTWLGVEVLKGSDPLTETQEIIELILPFDPSGKTNITVYRYHDAAAQKLTQAATKAEGTFSIDEANKEIHVFAKKFSTYAIGYTTAAAPSGPSGGAGSGSGTSRALPITVKVSGERISSENIKITDKYITDKLLGTAKLYEVTVPYSAKTIELSEYKVNSLFLAYNCDAMGNRLEAGYENPPQGALTANVTVDADKDGKADYIYLQTPYNGAGKSSLICVIKLVKASPTAEEITAGIKATKLTLKATKGRTYVKLTWKKSKGFKLDGYQIYRSTKKTSGFKKIFTTKKLSYKNTKNLKSGKTYWYKVRGFRKIAQTKVYTPFARIKVTTKK